MPDYTSIINTLRNRLALAATPAQRTSIQALIDRYSTLGATQPTIRDRNAVIPIQPQPIQAQPIEPVPPGGTPDTRLDSTITTAPSKYDAYIQRYKDLMTKAKTPGQQTAYQRQIDRFTALKNKEQGITTPADDEQKKKQEAYQKALEQYKKTGYWSTEEGVRPMTSKEAQDYALKQFKESPDYQFRLQEGIRGIAHGAAASGLLDSGRYNKDIVRFAEDLASGEYGNWWNRLSALAGAGQTATQGVSNAGTNYANQAGQNYLYSGSAQGQGIMNAANANAAAQTNIANTRYLNSMYNQPNYANIGTGIGQVANAISSIDWSNLLGK